MSLWKDKMLDRYSLLRQTFLSIAEPLIDSNILDQLKRNYAHEINSKRKLSQIKDLQMFIRLLEKRDIMSYSNIQPLWYIMKKYIHKPDLQSKLEDYESWLNTVPLSSLCNKYQSDESECFIINSMLWNWANKLYLSVTGSILSPTSESTGSEYTCNSMCDLPESSIESSTKVFSNNTQTLHFNSECEEQYLYKRRKLLQETGIFKILNYIFIFFLCIYKCFFFKCCYKSKIGWVDLGEM